MNIKQYVPDVGIMDMKRDIPRIAGDVNIMWMLRQAVTKIQTTHRRR